MQVCTTGTVCIRTNYKRFKVYLWEEFQSYSTIRTLCTDILSTVSVQDKPLTLHTSEYYTPLKPTLFCFTLYSAFCYTLHTFPIYTLFRDSGCVTSDVLLYCIVCVFYVLVYMYITYSTFSI